MNWNNLADIPDFFSSKEKKKKTALDMNSIFFLINVLFFPKTFKILEKAESV